MVEAALGLGGNIGQPKQNLSRALNRLHQSPQISVSKVSRLFRTPPWGDVDQPDFLNACASIETSLDAHDLLQLCLSVEAEMGRTRDKRWGPRNIDIDVLFYGDLLLDDDDLQLPHPRMHMRGFVMVPLADISGEKQISGKAVAQWASELDNESIQPETDNGAWWQGS